MKKLAIVSSFSESCGNAAFAKILKDSIVVHTGFSVEILTLPLAILQSVSHENRKLSKKFIKDACVHLKTFDAVNIQLENGLYGTLPSDIRDRVIKLATANPKTSVTLHSPRLSSGEKPSVFRAALRKMLKSNFIGGFRDLMRSILPSKNVRITKKILNDLIKNKCRLIVHTKRAREQIKQLYDYDNIDVHPLRMVEEKINMEKASELLLCFRKTFGMKENDVFIGMFGYLSKYKGHLEALKAIQYLPAAYKLIIFGRQHPQTLLPDTVDPYLKLLVSKVCNNPALTDRVFFMGELSDEDLINVASSVDVVWLPYYENGQDGSGIASICCDVSRRVLASSSFAFDEFFKLIPYKNVMRFDIGNYLEMAHKTQFFMNSELSPAMSDAENPYTIKTQAMLYTKEFI